jgi:RNA polymerase sigma factor (sigma-70 family)
MQQEHIASLSKQASLTALYQRHAPALFAYLYRHASSLEDTEDLLLDVFEAALARPGFEQVGPREQEAWLWAVARNKVVDHHRVHARRPGLSLELMPEELYEPERETPETQLLRQEDYARLHASIQRLHAWQQEIVHLRFALGLRSAEIAVILQKSEGAVRVALSRTLKLLRKIYENE